MFFCRSRQIWHSFTFFKSWTLPAVFLGIPGKRISVIKKCCDWLHSYCLFFTRYCLLFGIIRKCYLQLNYWPDCWGTRSEQFLGGDDVRNLCWWSGLFWNAAFWGVGAIDWEFGIVIILLKKRIVYVFYQKEVLLRQPMCIIRYCRCRCFCC